MLRGKAAMSKTYTNTSDLFKKMKLFQTGEFAKVAKKSALSNKRDKFFSIPKKAKGYLTERIL